MAKLEDLGDEEFMAAWDAASERAATARDECKAYGAEHQRRLTAAEAQRLLDKEAAVAAGEVDPNLDQVVGKVQDR